MKKFKKLKFQKHKIASVNQHLITGKGQVSDDEASVFCVTEKDTCDVQSIQGPCTVATRGNDSITTDQFNG